MKMDQKDKSCLKDLWQRDNDSNSLEYLSYDSQVKFKGQWKHLNSVRVVLERIPIASRTANQNPIDSDNKRELVATTEIDEIVKKIDKTTTSYQELCKEFHVRINKKSSKSIKKERGNETLPRKKSKSKLIKNPLESGAARKRPKKANRPISVVFQTGNELRANLIAGNALAEPQDEGQTEVVSVKVENESCVASEETNNLGMETTVAKIDVGNQVPPKEESISTDNNLDSTAGNDRTAEEQQQQVPRFELDQEESKEDSRESLELQCKAAKVMIVPLEEQKALNKKVKKVSFWMEKNEVNMNDVPCTSTDTYSEINKRQREEQPVCHQMLPIPMQNQETSEGEEDSTASPEVPKRQHKKKKKLENGESGKGKRGRIPKLLLLQNPYSKYNKGIKQRRWKVKTEGDDQTSQQRPTIVQPLPSSPKKRGRPRLKPVETPPPSAATAPLELKVEEPTTEDSSMPSSQEAEKPRRRRGPVYSKNGKRLGRPPFKFSLLPSKSRKTAQDSTKTRLNPFEAHRKREGSSDGEFDLSMPLTNGSSSPLVEDSPPLDDQEEDEIATNLNKIQIGTRNTSVGKKTPAFVMTENEANRMRERLLAQFVMPNGPNNNNSSMYLPKFDLREEVIAIASVVGGVAFAQAPPGSEKREIDEVLAKIAEAKIAEAKNSTGDGKAIVDFAGQKFAIGKQTLFEIEIVEDPEALANISSAEETSNEDFIAAASNEIDEASKESVESPPANEDSVNVNSNEEESNNEENRLEESSATSGVRKSNRMKTPKEEFLRRKYADESISGLSAISDKSQQKVVKPVAKKIGAKSIQRSASLDVALSKESKNKETPICVSSRPIVVNGSANPAERQKSQSLPSVSRRGIIEPGGTVNTIEQQEMMYNELVRKPDQTSENDASALVTSSTVEDSRGESNIEADKEKMVNGTTESEKLNEQTNLKLIIRKKIINKKERKSIDEDSSVSSNHSTTSQTTPLPKKRRLSDASDKSGEQKKPKKRREEYECYLCDNVTFSSKLDLRVHGLESHNHPPKFCCEICDDMFGEKTELMKHKRLKHTKDELMCFLSPPKTNNSGGDQQGRATSTASASSKRKRQLPLESNNPKKSKVEKLENGTCEKLQRNRVVDESNNNVKRRGSDKIEEPRLIRKKSMDSPVKGNEQRPRSNIVYKLDSVQISPQKLMSTAEQDAEDRISDKLNNDTFWDSTVLGQNNEDDVANNVSTELRSESCELAFSNSFLDGDNNFITPDVPELFDEYPLDASIEINQVTTSPAKKAGEHQPIEQKNFEYDVSPATPKSDKSEEQAVLNVPDVMPELSNDAPPADKQQEGASPEANRQVTNDCGTLDGEVTSSQETETTGSGDENACLLCSKSVNLQSNSAKHQLVHLMQNTSESDPKSISHIPIEIESEGEAEDLMRILGENRLTILCEYFKHRVTPSCCEQIWPTQDDYAMHHFATHDTTCLICNLDFQETQLAIKHKEDEHLTPKEYISYLEAIKKNIEDLPIYQQALQRTQRPNQIVENATLDQSNPQADSNVNNCSMIISAVITKRPTTEGGIKDFVNITYNNGQLVEFMVGKDEIEKVRIDKNFAVELARGFRSAYNDDDHENLEDIVQLLQNVAIDLENIPYADASQVISEDSEVGAVG